MLPPQADTMFPGRCSNISVHQRTDVRPNTIRFLLQDPRISGWAPVGFTLLIPDQWLTRVRLVRRGSDDTMKQKLWFTTQLATWYPLAQGHLDSKLGT